MEQVAFIKKVFKENFLRELTDEEAGEFVNKMIFQTREDFSKSKGFTEDKFERYISKNLVMAFSPNAVYVEIKRIIDEIGIEALENSSKYKRLSEMNNACCLVLALKKIFNEEWMIKAQDSPDIILVKQSLRLFNDKHLDAVMLEIMEIPEQARSILDNDIELGIAKFIQEKKFNKRYDAAPNLLVHLNINQQNLNLQRVSDILNGFSNNPFYQIWSRINIDPNFQIINMSLLASKPAFKFYQTKINFINDRGIFF